MKPSSITEAGNKMRNPNSGHRILEDHIAQSRNNVYNIGNHLQPEVDESGVVEFSSHIKTNWLINTEQEMPLNEKQDATLDRIIMVYRRAILNFYHVIIMGKIRQHSKVSLIVSFFFFLKESSPNHQHQSALTDFILTSKKKL